MPGKPLRVRARTRRADVELSEMSCIWSPATPHTASENQQTRRPSHSAARSPVLQLRMMLGTPEASRHLMRACTQCDVAEREHEGRSFAVAPGERRPDGTIRLDDWRTLLMTGRTGTVSAPVDPTWQQEQENEDAAQVSGAPLSGHAGGYAKLTAQQVSQLIMESYDACAVPDTFYQAHRCDRFATPLGRHSRVNCKAWWYSTTGQDWGRSCRDYRLSQIRQQLWTMSSVYTTRCGLRKPLEASRSSTDAVVTGASVSMMLRCVQCILRHCAPLHWTLAIRLLNRAYLLSHEHCANAPRNRRSSASHCSPLHTSPTYTRSVLFGSWIQLPSSPRHSGRPVSSGSTEHGAGGGGGEAARAKQPSGSKTDDRRPEHATLHSNRSSTAFHQAAGPPAERTPPGSRNIGVVRGTPLSAPCAVAIATSEPVPQWTNS